MNNNEEKKDKTQSEAESSLLSADPMSRFNNQKTEKISGSKKKLIGIICGVVVVAGLAGGVVAVTINGIGSTSTTDETEETVDENGITLFNGNDSSEVKTIELENSEGTFEIYRSKDETDDESAEFTLKGYEDYELETSIIGTLANNIVGLSTYETVSENETDLDKFGLGDDAIKATVTLDDGTSESFRIGSLCADTSYKYFCLEGEDTVYTVDVSKVNNYSYGTDGFVSKDVAGSLEDDEEVTYLKISRSDIDYNITLEYDEEQAEENEDEDEEDDDSSTSTSDSSDLVMVEPVPCALSSSKVTDYTEGVFSLSADEFVAFGVEESDFSKYGLDEPYAEIAVKTSESKSYVMKIGDTCTKTSDEDSDTTETTEDDTVYRYVYIDGYSDIVYLVDESSLTWLTVEPIDITSKIIIDSMVWDIGTLNVETADGTELNFVGSGTDKSDYVVTKNNEECETERFRAFYAFLIKAYAEEIVTDETTDGKDLMLKVTYAEQDGGESKTIEFYDDGNTKCLISVDGVAAFKCRKSFVNAVLSNIEIFDTDEDFATTWE